eukprot:4065376-Pleurochrysis_carterae.AAC.1
MVFIIRGNWHNVKHSCQSDASDRAEGIILPIPLLALTAVNCLPMTHLGEVIRVVCNYSV